MADRRKGVILGFLIGAAVSVIFVFGFLAGNAFGRHQATSEADLSNPDVRDFLAAYRLVTQQSYFRPLNSHRLVYAAIDSMLSATGDPHTVFLSPGENRTANQELNGAGFSGIGAIVVPADRTLKVLALVPGGPAARAGLHANDVLTAINGRSVAGMSADAAIGRIHGPPGTHVRLTVRRGATNTLVVRVKREQIAPITAYPRVLRHHLGYVQILSFGVSTADEVERSLRSLRADHVRGLIIDLRGNPGGYVDAAQHIVSELVPRGIVAYEEQSRHHLTALKVIPGQQILSVPMAILVDGGTASAAEITSAALRDNAGAVLLGTRTYGKGSMQSVYTLADGSTVRITDRLWLTPGKRSISHVGLAPNILVSAVDPSHPGNADPQLRAAEQYLSHHVTG